MRKNNPILINVPHSATYIPQTEKKYFTTPDIAHELNVMTDHYCDDLYDTGDKMIRFTVSRLVCDPERFRDDSEEIMASSRGYMPYTKDSVLKDDGKGYFSGCPIGSGMTIF